MGQGWRTTGWGGGENGRKSKHRCADGKSAEQLMVMNNYKRGYENVPLKS